MQSFDLIANSEERCQRLGDEFLAQFYCAHTKFHPDHLDALSELGHALTRLGRLEEGLATDRKLARLQPENPLVLYNLACSLALLGQVDASLDSLDKAIQCGYDDPKHLAQDEDLTILRKEPRFVDLLASLRTS